MTPKSRVLCLDDEPYVLDGLRRHLRAHYDVVTTTQPQEALELLADGGDNPIAVVVSDMRMPQMTGVEVLERARQLTPETTRILLTGDADLHSAVAAINQGNVFRFMLKPCPPEDLRTTMAAASEQNRLVRAERELLEATLKGCVDALMETLGMAQPALFSRAGRLRRLVERVCQKLGVEHAWQIEMAAQMGEIGAITLPPEAIAGLEGGTPGSPAQAEMLASLPKVADGVLARIPRLEAVREIVRHQLPTDRNPIVALHQDAPDGARLLQAVREYDALVWRGMPPDLAVATLSSRKIHDRDLLLALAEAGGLRVPSEAVREVEVDDLKIGDELANDVYSAKGMMLVSRGQVITERLLIRLRNYETTTGLQGRILIVDLLG
ncbi:response regulator [Planosporangium flavigriseum]|uniref:Response regulator receiver modulated metal-depenent phosphohydrolase n=1 Tax=Planosporangium flavigriseum TaxID=373681 RepID=A0A8J3LPH6_9ACTN|nr:response regulator [Planosporangium flavigriseum]NJC67946.1 response regulator [Planosporangium flavigriseum]GIG76467.1 response regulator receiver modulated metal-depenent phosphohydrolase [Planosporangium flavigriseum]